MIVAANVPSSDLAGLKAKTTASQILSFGFTAASQNTANGIEDVTLIGDQSSLTVETNTVDTHTYKEAAVELVAITARVEIGTVVKGTGIENVELVAVAFNNYHETYAREDADWIAYADTDFSNWGTQSAGSPVVQGTSATAFPAAITMQSSDTYFSSCYFDYADASVVTGGAKAYAYHVFTKAATLPRFAVLVRGEFTDAYTVDSKKYFLQWVTFSKFIENSTELSTLTPNNVYQIGLTSGIVINAKDLSQPPFGSSFDLGVKVSVKKWSRKTITPGV